MKFLPVVLLCLADLQFAASVPYSQYILAPSSRTIYPDSVYRVNGTVAGSANLIGSTNGSAVFKGVSAVTLDFGKNIAGVVSVTAGKSSSRRAVIKLTYSESPLWISGIGSDATANAGLDEPLLLPVGNGPNTYTVAREHERGAFRYLSLVNSGNDSIEVTGVSIDYTAAPQQHLQDYTGYFHCNDELLNRIWYAGAYTNQLCNIDPAHGNSLVSLANADPNALNAWYNNYTVSNGTSTIVDGAKRDRLVWPGDMSVAMPSIFASTFDMMSVQNALDSLLVLQAADGLLPYAGVPFAEDVGFASVSFTYHLYSLIGISYYYHYTGDLSYVKSVWTIFKKGLAWSIGNIDSTGLMNVTSDADWLRSGMGGHNIEANAIFYYTLLQGSALANLIGDKSSAKSWTKIAAKVKTVANNLLWDASANLYTDNETTTLYPQDGNSWAVKSGLTLSDAQNQNISKALKARWGPYGAPAPEASPYISPFIGAFELETHFLSSDPQTALDLLRLQWGYMLDSPQTTRSSFIEGYGVDGSMTYVFADESRVSHAHGWSTGPTSLSSFYLAGLQLVSASGQKWKIAPQPGDLTSVEAGFASSLGKFDVKLKASGGCVSELSFTTPRGTSGDVVLPGVNGVLVGEHGQKVKVKQGLACDMPGGSWVLHTRK